MIGTIVSEAAKKFYLKYTLGLLLCKGRKTCPQMAEATGISHDALLRALKHISEECGIQDGLIRAALLLLDPKRKWWLILDDSMILKPHAKKLRQAVLDHCGATGKVEKGLVAIFLSITDGNIIIPIGYRFWTNRKQVARPEDYRKKWEIGLELLAEVSDKLDCKNLLIDGAYANRYSLQILADRGFEYEARFRRNGVLVIDGNKRSVAEMLDHLLVGPRLYQTIRATWQNLDVFIAAHKHRNKSGNVITYTISNRDVPAIQHAKDYNIRWGTEMFFRTGKQSLGIQHCASPDIAMQRAHIDACIVAYVFLQHQRSSGGYQSPEEALKAFRQRYLYKSTSPITRTDQLDHAFA